MHTHKCTMGGPGSTPEATQLEQAQGGCPECIGVLMARHNGLVQAVVRRQVLGDLPFTEALQAGRIGLWRAILGYDPSRGRAFSTYAWTCIMRHVWRAVKVHGRQLAHPPPTIPADRLLQETADPVEMGQASAVQAALYDLVQRLPDRLRYVVIVRYGLDGNPPAFYRQIGAALRISGERARQLHTEALVWLRQPAHSQTLRSLLDHHTLADYEFADTLAQRWLHRRRGGTLSCPAQNPAESWAQDQAVPVQAGRARS